MKGRLVEFKAFGPEEGSASLLAHQARPACQLLLLWPSLGAAFPTWAQDQAVYTGSLGTNSAGHTQVSFCTDRSAG
jgi:hypothetical protein